MSLCILAQVSNGFLIAQASLLASTPPLVLMGTYLSDMHWFIGLSIVKVMFDESFFVNETQEDQRLSHKLRLLFNYGKKTPWRENLSISTT